MTFDENVLSYIGGIRNNDLNNILETNDSNDELQTTRRSSYYDLDNFDKLTRKTNKCFSILSTNIQSLNSKFSELEAFVDDLSKTNFKFSVICLQETWLTDNDDLCLFSLPGYDCISQGKHCSGKGGLVIYVDNTYISKVKLNINMHESWEGLIVRITGGGLTKTVTLGNIYRPPRSRNDDLNSFINEFGYIISSLENNNSHLIFAGDFNINLLKLNENDTYSNFFDTLISHSLYPLITLPTRFTRTNGTLIDNFFCKLCKSVLESTAGILTKRFSDHQPYFMMLNTNQKTNPPPKFIKKYNTSDEAMLNVRHEIQSEELFNKLDKSCTADINLNYEMLNDEILRAKHKHMRCKLVKFNKYKHKKSTWITQGLLKSIRYRDKLYKKLRLSNPNTLHYDTLKFNLKTYNLILSKSIISAKQTYYESRFNRIGNDIRRTWKTINEILTKNQTKNKFPTVFNDDGSMIADRVNIANKFNVFFTNIGEKIAKGINYDGNKNYDNYLNKEIHSSFTLMNIDEAAINKIINNLPPKSSSGCDGISSKLLKVIAPVIIKPLTLLINQVLNTGTFPDKLKIAKVIPIFKKGDPSLFENYRPISLLPAISKVLEKIIALQLSSYFETNKLLFDNQYGFRPKHSTEHAALELIDRIINKMDTNEIPLNIFLDLSKAFDTIDHTILLNKLKYYGLKGPTLNLFQSYLTNRRQYTEIEDTTSTILPIQVGVPQGSILGPILFIIYVNDLPQCSNKFDFIMYADDTTLSSTIGSFSDINSNTNADSLINAEICKVIEWLKLNKLSLNKTKSKYMTFHMPKKEIPHLALTIDGVNIEKVEEFNFLGLTIDTNLKWKKHTDKISNKCSKITGVLNRLKLLFPQEIKCLLYNSLIVPHINYCITAWGFHRNRITIIQKKAIRIITASSYISHTEPLFKQLNLLKVEDILTLHELKFYFKYNQGILPKYLQNWNFIPNSKIHNHNTRKITTLHTLKTKHEFAKKTLKYNLPYTINNTPHIVKDKVNTHSFQGFSLYVKQYLIRKYNTNCISLNCYICEQNA